MPFKFENITSLASYQPKIGKTELTNEQDMSSPKQATTESTHAYTYTFTQQNHIDVYNSRVCGPSTSVSVYLNCLYECLCKPLRYLIKPPGPA